MIKCFASTISLFLLAISPAVGQPVPRVETNFSYAYIRFAPEGVAPTFHANGGHFQFIYNFNNWLGVVGDFGGYSAGGIRAYGYSSNIANFQAGPRLSFWKKSRVNPYIQGLFGGAFISANPDLSFVVPPGANRLVLESSVTKFALLAGGGLDIRLARHVALRAFEADYFYTKLPNPVFTPENMTNNLRVSAGFSFLFGGEKPAPPPPPAPSFTTCPDGSKVPAGQPCPKLPLAVNITGARGQMCQNETMPLASSLSGNKGNNIAFQWTVNGQPAGQGPTLSFGGVAPGTYSVGVTASGTGYQPATNNTTISVLEKRAPTGTVTASPSEVMAGQRATLSASFSGQCCDPISAPTFTASQGAISGSEFDSSGVTFDASDHSEQRRAVTITAKVTDQCNNEGTATTSITVVQKATAAPVRLPDVLFPQNSARVNNCGKRVLLEQLRTYFERDPAGKAVLVGHVASNETAPNLAADRARNAAAVITAGSGVCLSLPADQVLVSAPGSDQMGVDFQPNFCGASVMEQRGATVNANDPNAKYRRVVVWFVPSGAETPQPLGDYRTAASMKISGCPR
jgi:hypothetical protein